MSFPIVHGVAIPEEQVMVFQTPVRGSGDEESAMDEASVSPLSGSFGGGVVRVLEISATRLTALHRERLTVGRRGPMTIVVGEGGRVVLIVRVARSTLVKTDGQVGYVSDFEILEESIDAAARLAIGRSGGIPRQGNGEPER